ncbi:hypothetical protein CEXT_503861 [Caerostris extrusa]|uniref:Uncharacterized protein n=1 Tax=Caerostris extrusa TaxID=172846 RepID=A0AAV4VVB3_CAEEX|nr:hypothetical protein CEXT_503861 [Caerostris extrusa]
MACRAGEEKRGSVSPFAKRRNRLSTAQNYSPEITEFVTASHTHTQPKLIEKGITNRIPEKGEGERRHPFLTPLFQTTSTGVTIYFFLFTPAPLESPFGSSVV